MEDGVEALLELAADTEILQDNLADVDLSSGEAEDGDEEEEEGEERRNAPNSLLRSRTASASSVLMSPSSKATFTSVLMSPSSNATFAAAAAGGGISDAVKVRVMPTLQNTSWDKEDVGNEDTTEVGPVEFHRIYTYVPACQHTRIHGQVCTCC